MAVLVMDTATDVCAVAAGEEGLLSGTFVRVPRSHSKRLHPAIGEVLQHAGLTVSDLTEIGVGVGPGSYTGVRIAVSAAKTMAFALAIPVRPIPTLAALAAAAVVPPVFRRTLVMPLLYARRGRAFGAVYAKEGTDWTCVEPVSVQPVTEWRSALARQAEADSGVDCTVIHDFVPRYGLADELSAMPARVQMTLGEAAGSLGQGLFQAMANSPVLSGDAVHTLEPVYALQTEAEANLSGGGNR